MSSSTRLNRIVKEMKELAKDPLAQVTLEAKDGSDLSKLKGGFKGPSDTPYEGGTFYVDITVGDRYPFQPPKVMFSTRVLHPNISSQTVSSRQLLLSRHV